MQALKDFIASSVALVAAFAALAGGLATLTREIRHLQRARKRTPAQIQPPRTRRIRLAPVLVGTILLVAAVATFGVRYMIAQNEPLNVRLTREAWDGFNGRKWSQAISKADECVLEFGPQADGLQAQLEKAKSPLPPVGAVTEAQKTEIFRNGL